MDRQEIIVKVKLRLDELGPFEEGQVVDSGRIDHYLNDSVKRLLMIVPPYIPTPTSFSDDSSNGGSGTPTENSSNDDGTGYIILPDDFVRFVALKMNCWKRTVTTAMSENDPRYARQSNPFIRGSADKPIVVYRSEPGVGKVLEYYSVRNANHAIDRGLYLAACVAEDLDEELVDPLSWLVAETILNTVGEFELAKAANAKLMEWINMRAVI